MQLGWMHHLSCDAAFPGLSIAGVGVDDGGGVGGVGTCLACCYLLQLVDNVNKVFKTLTGLFCWMLVVS